MRSREPLHETLALRELFECDELVGRMRLRDVAGAADHRRNADPLEQSGFGPVRHLAHRVVASVIAGATSAQQVQDNAAAATRKLTAADLEEIDSLLRAAV